MNELMILGVEVANTNINNVIEDMKGDMFNDKEIVEFKKQALVDGQLYIFILTNSHLTVHFHNSYVLVIYSAYKGRSKSIELRDYFMKNLGVKRVFQSARIFK